MRTESPLIFVGIVPKDVETDLFIVAIGTSSGKFKSAYVLTKKDSRAFYKSLPLFKNDEAKNGKKLFNVRLSNHVVTAAHSTPKDFAPFFRAYWAGRMTMFIQDEPQFEPDSKEFLQYISLVKSIMRKPDMPFTQPTEAAFQNKTRFDQIISRRCLGSGGIEEFLNTQNSICAWFEVLSIVVAETQQTHNGPVIFFEVTVGLENRKNANV